MCARRGEAYAQNATLVKTDAWLHLCAEGGRGCVAWVGGAWGRRNMRGSVYDSNSEDIFSNLNWNSARLFPSGGRIHAAADEASARGSGAEP